MATSSTSMAEGGGGEEETSIYPQKKYFRSRAHCNPLSNNDVFSYPSCPSEMRWSELFERGEATILDVGCGFGGLMSSLATLTEENILALEIRPKVCEFVRRRIEALRKEKGGYRNAACLRSNATLYLPNMIKKAQLSKLFFCFPDPHFKAKNHRRRVISAASLAEYAYALKPDGLIYAITDVRELHDWHLARLSQHPCFEPLLMTPDEEATDPFVRAIVNDTEEGQKVARNNGLKFWLVYRRKHDLSCLRDHPPLFSDTSQ